MKRHLKKANHALGVSLIALLGILALLVVMSAFSYT